VDPGPRSGPVLSEVEGPGPRLFWLHALNAAAVPLAVVLFLVTTGHGPTDRDHLITVGIVVALGLLHLVSAVYWRKASLEAARAHEAQLARANHQLQTMAMHDDLTGLVNRRYFYQRLGQELHRARRSATPLALLVLDVDGFKAVNDNHGHQAGDLVLTELGKLLTRHTRAGDVPARIGGDEFAVIMPDTDREGALRLAERLEQALADACQSCPQRPRCPVNLCVSLGVSGYPWGGDTVDELVRCADSQMYAAKAARARGSARGGKRRSVRNGVRKAERPAGPPAARAAASV